LVNVTARIFHGFAVPVATSSARRAVRTRVLPVPAPDKTSNGPSSCWTASFCAGFRPSSHGRWGIAAIFMMRPRSQIAAVRSTPEVSQFRQKHHLTPYRGNDNQVKSDHTLTTVACAGTSNQGFAKNILPAIQIRGVGKSTLLKREKPAQRGNDGQ